MASVNFLACNLKFSIYLNKPGVTVIVQEPLHYTILLSNMRRTIAL